MLVLPLCGCVSVGSLERSSLEHEARARQLAEHGDGLGAAREYDQAAADDVEARLRAQTRRTYWDSEVLMH